MNNYIIKIYVSFFIIIAPLFGQISKKTESKTFLFGLIKFDRESTYESGYWFDKWFRSREFAAPVNFIPIELRYGIGFNGDFAGSFSNPSAPSIPDPQFRKLYSDYYKNYRGPKLVKAMLMSTSPVDATKEEDITEKISAIYGPECNWQGCLWTYKEAFGEKSYGKNFKCEFKLGSVRYACFWRHIQF